MGYKLNNLSSLPLDEKIRMYIFAIGVGSWEGALGDIIRINFDRIASKISPSATIVSALTEEMGNEIVEKYLGKTYNELKNEFPALLLTSAHPDRYKPDSPKYLFSLRIVHEKYEIIDDFLEDLIAFARNENRNLLNRLGESVTLKDAANQIVEVSVPILPGIAFNPVAAIKLFRKWWNNRHKRLNNSGGA